MGVPGLFFNIIGKYPKTIKWKAVKTDYLFMDYNAFMHDTIGSYISRNRQELSGLSKPILEERIIVDLVRQTVDLVNEVVQPRQLLFISVDGVAPLAKIHHQRARRYKSIYERKMVNYLKKKHGIPKQTILTNGDVWSSSNISPGTRFQYNFSQAMKSTIQSGKFKTDVVFSDSSEAGEGEFKITQYINKHLLSKQIDKSITIYSPDADLIILSFLYSKLDIKILKQIKERERKRYPANIPDDVNHIYFDINLFRNSLFRELGWEGLEQNRMVLDFIFISFFGGNDFVKPIPYLKMNQRVWNRDGMSNIVKIYNKVKDKFAKNEYLINVSGDLDKSLFEINFAFFKELVGEMAKQEDIAMKQIDKHQKRMFNKEEEEDGGFEIDFNNFEHSYYFSKKHVDPKHKKYRKEFSKINYRLPYKKWRKQYNSYFFKEDIGKVVEDYLKSLSFTLEYYVGGIPPSWRWVYPFRVAPLSSDIYRYLENKNKINVFENGNDKPFKPLEQLFMISNPQMTELLPDKYGKLMFDKRLKKYYPDNFELDVVVGKKYIYSDPLLPELDFKEIVGVLENVELGEEDRLLNN